MKRLREVMTQVVRVFARHPWDPECVCAMCGLQTVMVPTDRDRLQPLLRLPNQSRTVSARETAWLAERS